MSPGVFLHTTVNFFRQDEKGRGKLDNGVKNYFLATIKSFTVYKTNKVVLRWSLWWAFASCGIYQVCTHIPWFHLGQDWRSICSSPWTRWVSVPCRSPSVEDRCYTTTSSRVVALIESSTYLRAATNACHCDRITKAPLPRPGSHLTPMQMYFGSLTRIAPM